MQTPRYAYPGATVRSSSPWTDTDFDATIHSTHRTEFKCPMKNCEFMTIYEAAFIRHCSDRHAMLLRMDHKDLPKPRGTSAPAYEFSELAPHLNSTTYAPHCATITSEKLPLPEFSPPRTDLYDSPLLLGLCISRSSTPLGSPYSDHLFNSPLSVAPDSPLSSNFDSPVSISRAKSRACTTSPPASVLDRAYLTAEVTTPFSSPFFSPFSSPLSTPFSSPYMRPAPLSQSSPSYQEHGPLGLVSDPAGQSHGLGDSDREPFPFDLDLGINIDFSCFESSPSPAQDSLNWGLLLSP